MTVIKTILLIIICVVFVIAVPTPPNNRQNVRNQPQQQQQQQQQQRPAPLTSRSDSLRNQQNQLQRHHTTTPGPSVKRSERCLIHMLAEYNSIDIDYKQVAEHGMQNNKTYTFELLLGDEKYEIRAIGKKKGYQELAEMALKRTKYPHPPVKDRTCAISKSVVSELQEWAQRRNLTVSYEVVGQTLGEERTYTVECSIDSVYKTTAIHANKKTAKSEAAEKMYAYIQTVNIPIMARAKGIERYNTTEAARQNPIARLHEIQAARRGLDPVFKTIYHNTVPSTTGQTVSVLVEAKIDDQRTTGQGRNFRLAKTEAAENMLRRMGFTV